MSRRGRFGQERVELSGTSHRGTWVRRTADTTKLGSLIGCATNSITFTPTISNNVVPLRTWGTLYAATPTYIDPPLTQASYQGIRTIFCDDIGMNAELAAVPTGSNLDVNAYITDSSS